MKKLPKFRPYDNIKLSEPYGWDYGHGKTRKRITFPTKKAKREYKENYERKFYNDRDALIDFEPSKWRKFRELEQVAGGINALEQAAQNAGRHDQISTIYFSEACELKFEEIARKKGVNLKRVKLYCERFIAAKSDKIIDQYSHDDCQGWIDQLTGKHRFNSLKNHHNAVNSVFNLAIKLGYLQRSPAKYVTFPTTRGEKRKELFEAADVKKILNYLWAENKPLAGVYALLFFTGLRISMVAPNVEKRQKGEYILPSMIDVKNKEIIIPEGIMKAENELIIDSSLAPENLWPWLSEIHNARIPEPAQTFNRRRQTICHKLDIKWPSNVHRRSCASYYAAIHGKSRTSELLGNTEEMIVKHYQVATFRAKADEYFQVFVS